MMGAHKIETLRIGMIGSGFMGLTYSEAVSKHVQDAQLVAVAGGKRAADLAAEYRVAAEPSPEAVFAREDVQGVILATPDQHRRSHPRESRPHPVHAGPTIRRRRAGDRALRGGTGMRYDRRS